MSRSADGHVSAVAMILSCRLWLNFQPTLNTPVPWEVNLPQLMEPAFSPTLLGARQEQGLWQRVSLVLTCVALSSLSM